MELSYNFPYEMRSIRAICYLLEDEYSYRPVDPIPALKVAIGHAVRSQVATSTFELAYVEILKVYKKYVRGNRDDTFLGTYNSMWAKAVQDFDPGTLAGVINQLKLEVNVGGMPRRSAVLSAVKKAVNLIDYGVCERGVAYQCILYNYQDLREIDNSWNESRQKDYRQMWSTLQK